MHPPDIAVKQRILFPTCTLPAVSDDGRSPGIQGVLVQRLREIPDGQITSAAKRGGLELTQILRLRRGENTDVRLSTLERLAKGLGVTAASLIAHESLKVEPPPQQSRGVDPRLVLRLIKRSRAFVADVQRFAEALPDDAPTPSRRGRARRDTRGKT